MASLVGTLGFFTFVFVSMPFKIESFAGAEGLLAAFCVCVPLGVATWWMFRQLNTRYSKREAKAVTTAFAVSTPVSLGVSLVLAQLGGSFVGALICTIAISTLLSFAVCLLVLRMTCHIEETEQAH
jgi:predicted permease